MMDDVGSSKTQESCQESSISIPKVNITGERQWVPRCLPELKPTKGMIFESLREGIKFYKEYADAYGFKTRLSGKVMKKDVVKRRYMLCTRQGYRYCKGEMRNKDDETIGTSIADNKKRNRPLTRVGCGAKISFYLQKDGKYKVTSFVEEHTHKLISPISQYHLKRNLTTTHMHFIASNKRINKGGVATYRFMKEVMGGYENVGASKNACKNFVRKMKTQIGESDAQMLLDILKKRKLASKAFKYEFSEDEDKTLTRVFWADPISQRNYAVFGDVMSFDTTYGSNKYSMIFCPFTGVDHHKRCVTFGAALLAKEDVESFVWLFENFLQAMGGHQPSYLITDQDPAMEIAIKKVFTVSKHRYLYLICLHLIERYIICIIGVFRIPLYKFFENIVV